MISRRLFIGSGLAVLASPKAFAASSLEDQLAAIEARVGGRLGVAAATDGGTIVGWRLGDYFPMCSTSKLLMTGALLARVDRGQEHLDRDIPIRPEDKVDYAPISEKRMNASMTLAELCEAAMTVSDNIAANLLLKALGGPQVVTAFARSIGDGKTRLDRTEPSLNKVPPGDCRDSTTPAAMLESLRSLALGDVLSPASRDRLQGWLKACRTGDARLRAGLPRGWSVGDKTGSWSDDKMATANDIAVAWPPEGKPLLITAYLAECPAAPEARNAALADVARIVSSSVL